MIIFKPETISLVSSNVTPVEMRDKMFDDYLNTQTVFADLIEVEISFNNCDRVALFNMDGFSVDLELTDDDTATVVQTKTVDLSLGGGQYRQWIVEQLYIIANATLKISINKAGSNAACGLCAIGWSTEIGSTQWGLTPGITDYSKKDINDFSQAYLKVGSWAKNFTIPAMVPLSALDAVYEDLVSYRGVLIVIDLNPLGTDIEMVRACGFIRDWDIKIDNPAIAWLNIDFQGVI